MSSKMALRVFFKKMSYVVVGAIGDNSCRYSAKLWRLKQISHLLAEEFQARAVIWNGHGNLYAGHLW